ncbi:unnamed protein product [Thelazia callipaeda]|uniref:cytochrome-c oxidase n=1 Tax=Thelazia callipaeda TaxID=103827 RepID=A0A0N5CTH6_THECL|nr:unnamed protein product [Thelazia callipaeda]
MKNLPTSVLTLMRLRSIDFPLSVSSSALCCHYVSCFVGSHTYNFSSKHRDSLMVETLTQFLVINFLVTVVGPGFCLVHYQCRVYREPELILKVTGHQQELSFDSFIKPLEDMRAGQPRLLEVDNRVFILFVFLSIDALSGLFFGQCLEICGANHSFIPIVLEITSLECWAG